MSVCAQEGERVMETFEKQLHLPVTRIDDSKRMLAALKVHSLLFFFYDRTTFGCAVVPKGQAPPSWPVPHATAPDVAL